MKKVQTVHCLLVAGFLAALTWTLFAAHAGARQNSSAGQIRLIVRADDIGSCHTANIACINSYRDGIARSVEVMVPAPWFNEAVKMLNENSGLDVGVHLTLTSEWEFCKWGPVTQAPSLVDEQGHFFPMTSQRPDFPPKTGFLEARPKIEEVEKELRAQIELAKKRIPNVSHLTCHMGTPQSTPELAALVRRLAGEYKLPVDTPGAKWAPPFGDNNATPEQREASLIRILENMQPGVWILVEHPGLDTPEMRALGHIGYWNVAAHRDGVTKAFTSQKVKEVIARRNIQLLSYADVWGQLRKEN